MGGNNIEVIQLCGHNGLLNILLTDKNLVEKCFLNLRPG